MTAPATDNASAIDLYDISVASCKQVVQATIDVLNKAEKYCAESALTTEMLIDTKLQENMRPLRYQIFAVALHSKEAMKALKTGEFHRPESYPEDISYAEAVALLHDARAALNEYTPTAINALSGQSVTVKIPDLDIPFDTEDFVLSFSHVNLYFHAATAYDILRREGVPLEKRDFLGDFRLID